MRGSSGFLCAAFSLLVLLSAGSVQGQSVLELIPQESLVAVQVVDLDAAGSRLDAFLAETVGPMGASMMVRMMLAEALGHPQLPGVDTAGTFGLFVLDRQDDEPLVCLLIPVSDYDLLVAESPAIEEAEADGLSRVNQDMIVQVGDFALLANTADRDFVLKVVEKVEAGGFDGVVGADEAARAADEPVWVGVNLALIHELYRPMMEEGLEQMNQMMESEQPVPAEFMEEYMQIWLDVLAQSEYLSLSIRPQQQQLTLRKNYQAVAGSDVAGMLRSGRPVQQEQLVWLDGQAWMSTAANVGSDFWRRYYELGLELMRKMAPEIPEQQWADIEGLAMQAAQLMGPASASIYIDMGRTPAFAMKYALEVTDTDRMREIVAESIEPYGRIVSGMYQQMGMDIDAEPQYQSRYEQYQGVDIDRLAFRFEYGDDDEISAIIRQIYGQELTYYMAGVDGLFLTGVPDIELLHEMIDRARANGQIDPQIQQGIDSVDGIGQAEVFGTFNFAKMLSLQAWVMAGQMEFDMQEYPSFESESFVSYKADVGDGGFDCLIAVPSRHITEVQQAMEHMQEVMMEHMSRQMQMQMEQQMQQ